MEAYSHIKIDSFVRIPVREMVSMADAEKLLTVKPKWSDEDAAVELFNLDSPGYFGVPLYHFLNWNKIAETVHDERVDGLNLSFQFKSKLREMQIEVFGRFVRMVQLGKTGFILDAPPGFGKTVCLIKMMEYLGKRTLIVVPKSDLLKQWKDRLVEHSNIPRSLIGQASDGKVSWKGKRVVIGLVHTLGLDRFGDEFKKNFGVVIFDEVDSSVPPATFSPVVTMFPSRYRIGATATTTRPDGMHIVFDKHVGQVRLKGKDEGRMKAKILIVQYSQSSGSVWAGSARMNRRGILISKLANNPARNQLVAKYIELIYKSHRRLVVLSDRTDQLVTLKGIMYKQYGIPKRNMGLYCRQAPKIAGGVKKEIPKRELERVASACRIIFATYGMLGRGTDIKDLAGLVYATPQANVKQSKGRIERICEGKKQPVVVDIVDMHYKDTRGSGEYRKKEYLKEGLLVREVS